MSETWWTSLSGIKNRLNLDLKRVESFCVIKRVIRYVGMVWTLLMLCLFEVGKCCH